MTLSSAPTRTPAADGDKAMVELQGVTKRYGDVEALHRVDLTVRKGEFVTLLGPSGSGKTTVLNLIAGMIVPSSGRIMIDGRDTTTLPTNQRGLGMVFQNYALMPHMTVFENIAFPLQVRQLPKDEIKRKVTEALDLIQLAHVAGRRPRELSGGQQQRISLARCIVYNPALILMDEPLGALDKRLREQMQLEIKRLHAELGITMLYVTHDQDEALTMSDRIVLMNSGRIEQEGEPDQLYFKPASVFSAEFIGSSNLLPGVVEVADGGSLELRTAIGTFPVPAADFAVAHGDPAVLLVRPENMTLTQGPDATSVQGIVEDSILLGGVVRHFIRCADRSTIIVQELNQPHRPSASRGDQVRAGWQPAHARLLPPSGAVMKPIDVKPTMENATMTDKQKTTMMTDTTHSTSRRSVLRAIGAGVVGAIAAPAVFTGRARAADKAITVTSWGGDYHKSVQEVFVEPFTKETGIAVTLVDNGDMAKVKAQVQSKAVQWDVIDAPAAFATSGAREDLWEPLDMSIIKPGAIVQAGAPTYMPMYLYSGGILWDSKRHPDGKHPVDFAGFYDVKRFPGRRVMRALASETLEVALIADGVAPKNLYPLDVERAFRALDRIKPHVSKWASTTPEQVSSVTQNEGDFSYSYFNRVKNAQKAGSPVDFSFEQTVNSLDYFAVPKGSPNKEAAMRFINFCLRTDRQVDWAVRGYYLPNTVAALEQVKASPAKAYLPDLNNGKNAIVNAEWWGANYTAVQKRYAEWMLS